MKGLSIRNFYIFSRRWPVQGLALFCGLLVSIGSAEGLYAEAVPADEFAKRQKLQELYQKQIPLMEQYLERNPTGDRAALFLFRLGEAYFESAKFAQISEQSSRAGLFTQKAIESLEKLRRSYPQYERMDEALLVLATTYLERGDEASAGPVLADIADRFPNSPIMEQASSLLGDYYFAKGRLPQASQYYERATKTDRSKAYAFYKLAWIAIQQLRPAVALQNFEKVLQINAQATGQSFDYSKDAARELVWPALEVYKESKVIPYLEKILPSQELLKESLNSFANGLNEKSNYRLASEVFAYLLNRFPSDAQQASWISGQLKAEESLGRSSKIVELVSQLNTLQGGGADAEALQSQIYSSAKKFHSLAQKEKEEALKAKYYDQAIAYYEAFDRLGFEGAKAAETKFYQGEALFARGRYAEAMNAYESSISNSQHEKYSEALWNLYLTAEKLAPGFSYQGKELQAVSPMDEKFLSAARTVAQSESLSIDKRRKASYQSARLLYQLNDFDRALPIFKALSDQHPTSEEGKLSTQLVLDIYNLRNDYQSVADYARNKQGVVDSRSRDQFSVIEQKAAFKLIQEKENESKNIPESSRGPALNQVAEQYMSFARNYPQSTLADTSVWAAIQLYATAATLMQDTSFQGLRSSFDLLRSSYPQSKNLTAAINLMGEFLSLQKPDAALIRTLENYKAYRNAWLALMRKEDPSKRGLYGQMLYEISSDEEKQALEKEFASLPVSPANRSLIARHRMRDIRSDMNAFEKISLADLSQLKTNTQKKLNSLDRLKEKIIDFVKLGDPQLAVESLQLLSKAYSHMGSSMRSAPIPKALQGEDREKYRLAVEDKAQSFDRQAQEAQALAQKTALELGEAS